MNILRLKETEAPASWGKKFSSREHSANQNGFTLVEVIAAIVLMGLVGGFTVFFLGAGMESFVLTKSYTEGALKSQVAITRLSLELKGAESIGAYTQNTSITYMNPALSVSARTISFASGIIAINGNTLVDNVQSFSLQQVKDADLDGDGDNDVTAINMAFTLTGLTQVSDTIYPRGRID